MKSRGLTKDEMFLVKLFAMAEAAGDISSEHDRYAVGRAVAQNDKSVDNIVRMLAQTNFIKKGHDNAIFLTPQGVSYVEGLKDR
jgi:hypothetical protein